MEFEHNRDWSGPTDKCWLSIKWLGVPGIAWYGPFDTKQEVQSQYFKMHEDAGEFIEWAEDSWQPASFDPYVD